MHPLRHLPRPSRGVRPIRLVGPATASPAMSAPDPNRSSEHLRPQAVESTADRRPRLRAGSPPGPGARFSAAPSAQPTGLFRHRHAELDRAVPGRRDGRSCSSVRPSAMIDICSLTRRPSRKSCNCLVRYISLSPPMLGTVGLVPIPSMPWQTWHCVAKSAPLGGIAGRIGVGRHRERREQQRADKGESSHVKPPEPEKNWSAPAEGAPAKGVTRRYKRSARSRRRSRPTR